MRVDTLALIHTKVQMTNLRFFLANSFIKYEEERTEKERLIFERGNWVEGQRNEMLEIL